MPTQHFIILGQYFGACERPWIHVHESFEPPRSYAYLCPECGDVWAKAAIEHQTFLALHRACPKHRPRSGEQVSGSLWLEWDHPFTNCLPPAVLRREFDLHINAMEIA